MPFIEGNRRGPLDEGMMMPATPGDLCYLEYKALVDAWNESPRWTTIHNEAKRIFRFSSDVDAAKFLAFFVFMIKKGMPYEEQKIKENGDI